MKLHWTIALLITAGLFVLGAEKSEQSPKNIVEQFVSMDIAGERLTPVGWRAADELFVTHNEPFQPKTLVIIGRNYAISAGSTQSETNAFYFGYEEVARVSSFSLLFAPTNPGIETRSFDKYIVVATKEVPPTWKIEGDQPKTMHLTAAAAIKYVTRMREKTTDPTIRRNADRTLEKLAPYR